MNKRITKEENKELELFGFGDYMIDFSRVTIDDFDLLINEIRRINELRGRK